MPEGMDATEDAAIRRESRVRGALSVARSPTSALPLLVTRIGADDHGAPVPLDHTAALTHGLDGRTDFHENLGSSAIAEGDPAAGEVIGRELDLDAVAGGDANVVLPHLARDRGEHGVTFVQLHPEHRARERLDHLAFDLDLLFLDCH